jgi:hypothetical protein
VKPWPNCARCGKKLHDTSDGYCDEFCRDGSDFKLGRTVVCEDEWINGTWEHFGPEPVVITGGRKQLLAECEKRGLYPKALLKPTSRGRGWEVKGENRESRRP